MKSFLWLLLFFGCGIFALYEQSKPSPNFILMFGALAIFIFGLYRLMKKIPDKNEEENE